MFDRRLILLLAVIAALGAALTWGIINSGC
jgi:hypothetical protein